MGPLEVLLLLVVLPVLLLVLATTAGVALGLRSAARANRVSPAVPTAAPALWRWSAGYGARLHRRLQRVAALGRTARAAAGGAGGVGELAADLERQACGLDDQICLARLLPTGQRVRRLFELERHVAELEQLAVRITTIAAQVAGGADPRGAAPLAERVRHLEEAVAEVRTIEAEALGEARALGAGPLWLSPPPRLQREPVRRRR